MVIIVYVVAVIVSRGIKVNIIKYSLHFKL
jgi:hypothetical protein